MGMEYEIGLILAYGFVILGRISFDGSVESAGQIFCQQSFGRSGIDHNQFFGGFFGFSFADQFFQCNNCGFFGGARSGAFIFARKNAIKSNDFLKSVK